jgi:hypothetical protein
MIMMTNPSLLRGSSITIIIDIPSIIIMHLVEMIGMTFIAVEAQSAEVVVR